MSNKKNIEKKLNPKQKKFVKHYLETGSVVNSAEKAGYGKPGSPRKNLGIIGQNVLNKPHVQTVLQKALESYEFDILIKETYSQILSAQMESCATIDDFTKLTSAKLKAIDQLHKVMGRYAPQKLDKREIKVSLQLPFDDCSQKTEIIDSEIEEEE